jgi:hypothetical protein
MIKSNKKNEFCKWFFAIILLKIIIIKFLKISSIIQMGKGVKTDRTCQMKVKILTLTHNS